MLYLVTDGQALERRDNDALVYGTVGYPVCLKLSGAQWDKVETITVRYQVSGEDPMDILVEPNNQGECWHVVPWEVTRSTKFTVCAIGDSSTPTTAVTIIPNASGYPKDEEAPAAPSETVYQQIMTKFNEAVSAVGTIAEAKEAAATSAEEAATSSTEAAASAASAASAAEQISGNMEQSKAYAEQAETAANEAELSASAAAESAKGIEIAEANAAASAEAAAESASDAISAKATVADYVEEAATAADNARNSEAYAESYASVAQTNANNAAYSKSEAEESAEAAAQSASNAAASAAAAAESAQGLDTAEENAGKYAAAAAASASNAAGSASAALASQNAAKTSEDNAKDSETQAASSASAAASSATAANQSKTDAESAKTAAEAAKTAAETAQSVAQASQAAAEGAKTAAASSAAAAAGSATSAQTHATTAQQAAETATSAAETAAEDAAGAVSEQLKEDVQGIVDNLDGLSEAIAIKETATGEVISVSDSADYRLLGLRLYGKSVQDGTPTPEAPVEIESAGNGGNITSYVFGQNLIDPMDAGKWEIANNATFEVLGNGKIEVTGTNGYSGITYKIPSDTLNLLKGKNCVISRTIDSYTNASAVTIVQIVVYTSSGTKYYRSINTPITIDADAIGTNFRLYANNTGTALDTPNTVVFSNLGIYFGDTAQPWDTYEPMKTLTYPTPNGLPGIPVESGGNYTDENGQQWICDEVDFGAGKKTQRVGVIDSYNSESVGDVYMSSTGQLTAGAKVLYPLSEPTETDLTPEQLAAYAALTTYKPNTTVTTDSSPAAGVSVDYVADTKTYIDNKLAAISEAIMGGTTNGNV